MTIDSFQNYSKYLYAALLGCQTTDDTGVLFPQDEAVERVKTLLRGAGKTVLLKLLIGLLGRVSSSL